MSQMNIALTISYTPKEVKTVIFQMGSIKAPVINGFPMLFYQQYQHIVRLDVTKVILMCLNNKSLLDDINVTHIALIPKLKDPGGMTHFLLYQYLHCAL